MIPKVIHYCWFGGNRKSKLIRDCIDSWRLHLPDYEIKEWNEKNSDLTIPFVRDAYKLMKWAFVADYIRLKVLYESGGIYLDTDMMVIKPFDSLLSNKCFFGAESKKFISAGIIGAEKNNTFIERCLLKYESIKVDKETDWNQIVMPLIITEIYKEIYGIQTSFDKKIKQGNIKIYPVDYFYPLPNKQRNNINIFREYIRPSTFAVHLWNASWVEHSEFYYLKKREFCKGFLKSMQTIFFKDGLNLSYIKKIGYSIKYSFKKNENSDIGL